MVQAYKWFRLAAHLGEEQAAMITAQLEKDMSPADLAVARKLVKEWTPK
jgi:TPR repeat protein